MNDTDETGRKQAGKMAVIRLSSLTNRPLDAKQVILERLTYASSSLPLLSPKLPTGVLMRSSIDT